MTETEQYVIPALKEIKEAREQLGQRVRETPVWQWKSDELQERLGMETKVFLKLELFQYAGSFKPRGALMNMMRLTEEQLKRGVTAVSAGNHAIAVAYAAKVMQTQAKVVMPKTASSIRVDRCKSYGAEVVLVNDVHEAFEKVKEIENNEQRSYIHPFDGYHTALGTATVGLELCEQVQNLDAVIIPIGGGGLCAGISSAVKQINPECKVYGVEPEGADTMRRSFKSGKPEGIDKVRTIADSLGAPHAEMYSFKVCHRNVDALYTITDQQMCNAMKLLFDDMKLALEPAGASATAAMLGPLKEKVIGKRTGIIVCGTNIDIDSFYKHISNAV